MQLPILCAISNLVEKKFNFQQFLQKNILKMKVFLFNIASFASALSTGQMRPCDMAVEECSLVSEN